MSRNNSDLKPENSMKLRGGRSMADAFSLMRSARVHKLHSLVTQDREASTRGAQRSAYDLPPPKSQIFSALYPHPLCESNTYISILQI